MKFATALAAILAQPLSTTDARKLKPGGTRVIQEISFGGLSGFKHHEILRSLLASEGSTNAKQVLSPRLNPQKRKALPLRNARSLSSTGNGKPCDPSSVDPDVGILSCGSGSLCEPNENSYLGGTCVDAAANQYSFPRSNMDGKMKKFFASGTLKNQPHQDMMLPTECDPASAEAADVGVLVCGEGKRCFPNAASAIGGYCESVSNRDAGPTRPRRQLYWFTQGEGEMRICDPTHENYMYFDCDCSGYDIATGTGTVPCLKREFCLGFAYPGCNDICVKDDFVFNFDNFTIPSYQSCVSTTTGSVSPRSFCFYETFDDIPGTCEMTINDQVCSSCNVTEYPVNASYGPYAGYPYDDMGVYFDCRNVDSRSYGEASTINLFPDLADCNMPPETPVQCKLCPGDNSSVNLLESDALKRKMINVDGYGTFSCYYLAIYSYYFSVITQDACPTVVAAIDSQCCAPICDICGDGGPLDLAAMANFSEYGEVYCYYLEARLADPAKCAEAKPLLVDACCGLSGGTPEPTHSPSDEDVKADANGTGGDPIDNSEEDSSFATADDPASVVLSALSALTVLGSAGSLLFSLYAIG